MIVAEYLGRANGFHPVSRSAGINPPNLCADGRYNLK